MLKLKYVVIVDDDETSSYLTQLAVQEFAVCDKIQTARNWQQAELIFERAQGEYPDFVLLDITMPFMSGFDFLDWYENNGYKGKTKFAMLTASSRSKDHRKAESYTDVIGYIEKPIDKEKFLEVISKVIKE